MDFQKLLTVADNNKAEAKYQASVKRFNSELPPPKKLEKSGVQSSGIKRFLEKKKAEENAKLVEAAKKKEKLLALRAQSSKNNKKAKIMASRTKDNDFSKIKLTDDEVNMKKKVEQELLRKDIADKVERMTARIKMEELEKLQPKKRKRKSKHNGEGDNLQNHMEEADESHENSASVKKKHRPPPPLAMSFSELLRVAEQKQHEKVDIPKKVKEDERPMTKKERKQYLEEQDRLRRKKERLERGEDVYARGVPNPSKSPKQPVVEAKIPASDPSKFKIPKSNTKEMPVQRKTDGEQVQKRTYAEDQNFLSKPSTSKNGADHKSHNGTIKSHKNHNKSSHKTLPSKNEAADVSVKQESFSSIDTEAIAAAIEKRIREKLEKEVEAKLLAKFGLTLNGTPDTAKEIPNKVLEKPPPKPQSSLNSKPPMKVHCQTVTPKKTIQKDLIAKREPDRNSAPKPMTKKPFHKNPYLEPPRRLLVPQLPRRPLHKRRLESDEDSDEDDMSDFIDDGHSQEDEDYSKHIKEIFNYDRSRYRDIDDDDIMETSFAEQMKEECRSARIGILEDLEEERKERVREKKKKGKGNKK